MYVYMCLTAYVLGHCPILDELEDTINPRCGTLSVRSGNPD